MINLVFWFHNDQFVVKCGRNRNKIMPLSGWPSKNRRCACLDPPGCDEVDTQTIFFFLKRIKKRKRIGPLQAFCVRVLFSLAEAYSCCPAHWPVSKARTVLNSAHWPVSKARTVLNSAHWPVSKARTVLNSAHWPVSKARTVLNSVHWPVSKARTVLNSAHWPVSKARTVLNSAHWPVSKARTVLNSAQQSLRGFLSQKRGVEGGSTWLTVFLERMRMGHCQAGKHANSFRGNVGVTSERQEGMYVGFCE